MTTHLPKIPLHEFHFVMGRGMKETLKSMDMFRESRSLSLVIVKILTLITPIVKREHKWGIQRMSRYMPVTSNPDEEREYVHVYLPENMYRRLKLMHQDLNVFSIAQLIRFFLEVFLGLVELYGDGVVDKLEKLFRQWNKENRKTRLTTREIVRQLRRILQHLPGQDRLINIYNEQFSPFWVFHYLN